MRKVILPLMMMFLMHWSCEDKKDIPVGIDPVSIRLEFKNLLDEYYEGVLKLDPIKATFAGDKRYNATFPNYLSKEYKDSSIAFYKRIRDQAKGLDETVLNDSDVLSNRVLLWDCEINLEELTYRKEFFPLDQMWTRNLKMGQLASGLSAQPFETVEDYENWLQRVNEFIVWLETAQIKMKEGAAIRYVLPSSIIIKVIPQLKELTSDNVEDHLFYSPVKIFPTSFTKDEKETLRDAYRSMLENKLIPAFKALHKFVSTEYLDAGRASSGIDAIPNGKKYYNFAIKKYTTTDLSAEEIHQIGLGEVARILAEMEDVKKEVEFEGDIILFFDYVREKEKLMPFNKPEQVVNNFNAIHKRMKPELKKLFGNEPKTRFEVRRTEAFREASASAEYNQGSLDGTRPGIFYVPIPDASMYNTFTDESLFLHEAIPGHHYQMSLTQENDSLPYFRKTLWYSAYGEGWALYTESLGKELGLYKDPYQYFGMLSAEMHRAIRLVVDTGLHAKGWTREQAIQYSMENEAEPKASIIAEVERYMANPGQALSYKIGQLKILELRGKAEAELGDDFDIVEFHTEVLETGCIPLALLEDKIEKWIEMNK